MSPLLLLLLAASLLSFPVLVVGRSTRRPHRSPPSPSPSQSPSPPTPPSPSTATIPFFAAAAVKKLETVGQMNRHMAREFLDAHNSVREYYNEPPFAWNRTLAMYARRWSTALRADCTMQHSGGPYGENMFWGTGRDWRAADAVGNWAVEHYNYDPDSNSCLPGRTCGHFTQIVWNATASVGCARVECLNGGVVITCNYDPPGNYVGESPFHVVSAPAPE